MPDMQASVSNRGAPTVAPPSFRFSTDDLPEREREPMFREVFGRNIIGVDVAEALGESKFRADVLVKQLPGLNILWADYCPLRGGRTRAQLADGRDSLVFQWSASPGVGNYAGREHTLASDDGVLISSADPGILLLQSAAPMVSLALPRKALLPMLRNGEDCTGRPVLANVAAFTLLRRYIAMLRQGEIIATPELQSLAAAHVCDLMALALGVTRDWRHLAQRGVGAALLAAIKKDISGNANGRCSVEAVASQRGISARQVQRLFERDGTSFTEFLREQRLLAAYRMLVSPRFAHLRISDIAFEAGFADLSWFNRQFRNRFESSPGDARNNAAGGRRTAADRPGPRAKS